MDLRQLEERRLNVLDVLLIRRLGIALVATHSRVHFAQLLPALVHAKRRVELKRPQLHSACEHWCIVFLQQVMRDILLGWDGVEGLAQVMDGRKRDLVDPRFALLYTDHQHT